MCDYLGIAMSGICGGQFMLLLPLVVIFPFIDRYLTIPRWIEQVFVPVSIIGSVALWAWVAFELEK